MIFETFIADVGPLEANLHLIADEATGEAALVDAGALVPELVDRVRDLGLRVGAILVTHLHHDHVAALGEYLARWEGCQVYSPAPLAAAPSASVVGRGDLVRAAGREFRVFKTSGHTPESISYYCAGEAICFVGDAIFAGAVGGASDDALHAEEIDCLRRSILTLPPRTELWSGHGPATSVEVEAAANPFFRPGFGRLA